ncbi:MAG: FkbM family methyltransferase [Clostridia bacterium]|nr:FkbM family methyltransferase [Clostridia bacterium]
MNKPILFYGMGDGADKALQICREHGIEVRGFFASDAFVRGQTFHGLPVLTLSRAEELYPDMLVLVTFASSLPEVMDAIRNVGKKHEIYIPDIPVFGDTCWSAEYEREHVPEIQKLRSLLYDETSRTLLDSLLAFRRFGRLEDLDATASVPDAPFWGLLHPHTWRAIADGGAWRGDTASLLLDAAPGASDLYCFEPDRHSFARLEAYAALETRARVHPIRAALWKDRGELVFDAGKGGSRNACAVDMLHPLVRQRVRKTESVPAVSLDSFFSEHPDLPLPDLIKLDVEGAEKETLAGGANILKKARPELLISLYHHTSDLFEIPLMLDALLPRYLFHLRRSPYIPAWDLVLLASPEEKTHDENRKV